MKIKAYLTKLRNTIICLYKCNDDRVIGKVLQLYLSAYGLIVFRLNDHHFTVNYPQSGIPQKMSNYTAKRMVRIVTNSW